jgi:hypothetical protein
VVVEKFAQNTREKYYYLAIVISLQPNIPFQCCNLFVSKLFFLLGQCCRVIKGSSPSTNRKTSLTSMYNFNRNMKIRVDEP